MSLSLLVNLKGFLVETRVDANIGNLRSIVVVEFLDVVVYSRGIGFDGCEDQEILQVLVLAERRGFEDDLFEQLDQFVGQVGAQECLHCHGDVIWISRFGNSGASDLLLDEMGKRTYLINELTAVDAFLQDVAPEFGIATLDEVSRLMLEHLILVRNLHELHVILSLLIRNEG